MLSCGEVVIVDSHRGVLTMSQILGDNCFC